MIPALLTLAVLSAEPKELLAAVQAAANAEGATHIRAQFANPKDADYFLEMRARDPKTAFTAHLSPAPKGWEKAGPYWIVLSKHQDIEQDHDPIYPAIETPAGWKLGPEIKEFEPGKRAQPTSITAWVKLDPAAHAATIQSRLRIKRTTDDAVILRLNPAYTLPSDAGVRRIGGILVWEPKPTETELSLRYSVRLDRESEDQIHLDRAYITAFWIPSLSRLPCLTDVTISGPKSWQLRSEGVAVKLASWPFTEDPKQQRVRYRCEVPISFPKVSGGEYRLAAERQDAGKTYRVWQFAPVNAERAKRTLENMVQAGKDLESQLGPWPFPGYECFETKGFYGIESYSYTLLDPSIAVRYVAHEMGHTYFGGLAPCAYVEDTWNEGVTTYVDDVLSGRNVDRPLETAYRSNGVAVPLSQLHIAWSNGNSSYSRGAYVMAMLEREIGQKAVLDGLRALCIEQRGKNTTWAHLRPYFEKAAGGIGLRWFWDQWISGANFPTVTLVDHQNLSDGTTVNLKQSAADIRYRIRLELQFHDGPTVRAKRVVTMLETEEALKIRGLGFAPSAVTVNPIPFTLSPIRQHSTK